MGLFLAHREFGGGPPVVILHGLFGSGRNWTSLARRLGDSWHVYALDLRNHGASPWAEEMTYPAMAEDLRDFLDREGIESAPVVGHSMGGKVAMALALAHGERVDALAVVDIAPVAYRANFSDYVAAMRDVDLSIQTRRAEVDAALRETIPDPGIRAFILQNLETRGGGLAWRLNLDALARNMDTLTSFPDSLATQAYHGHTLFLGGARSDYIQERHRPHISRLFPRSVIDIVRDAGHWVHAEQPERFLSRLESFLRSAKANEAV